MSKPEKPVSQRTMQRRLKARIDAKKVRDPKLKIPTLSSHDADAINKAVEGKEEQPIQKAVVKDAEQLYTGRVPTGTELDLEASLDVLNAFEFLGTLGNDLVGLSLRLRTEELIANVVPWEVTITTKHSLGRTTTTTCDPHPGRALFLAVGSLRERGGGGKGYYTGSMRRVLEILDRKRYPYGRSIERIAKMIRESSVADMVKAEDKKFLDNLEKAEG